MKVSSTARIMGNNELTFPHVSNVVGALLDVTLVVFRFLDEVERTIVAAEKVADVTAECGDELSRVVVLVVLGKKTISNFVQNRSKTKSTYMAWTSDFPFLPGSRSTRETASTANTDNLDSARRTHCNA